MMAYLTRPAVHDPSSTDQETRTADREPDYTGGRVGYSVAGVVQVPKIGAQITKAGNYLKNLLASRKPYTGAEQIGVSTPKTDFKTEQTFASKFQEYADQYFAGNWSAASKSIGESREKIRGIFQRLAAKGTGKRQYGQIATGTKTTPILDIPVGTRGFKDVTTDLKYNPKILTETIKKLVKQNKVNEKEFYNAKDMANILGIDSSNKKAVDSLTQILKQEDVLFQNVSNTKLYNLGDVSKKIKDWSSTKLVRGDVKASTERLKLEEELDQPLTRFIANLKNQTRRLSKDADIYVRNAVEDVGHAQSIKTISKYPNLFKNSNVKSMQTLTYQDPLVNQQIFQNQGFQGRYEVIFKELNKFVNKKVTKENIKDFNLIRDKLKENYTNLTKRIIAEAQDNPYFKGQEKRIPELKLSKLKIGDTFKSENIFADMSTIDPYYQVGQISKINPTAKQFKDLTSRQVEFYKQTIKNQTMDNLEKFYIKAGYNADEIEELKDILEVGSASKKGLSEGGRVGLKEGTTLGKIKSVGGTTLRGLERAAGPWMTPIVGLYTAITGEAPDMTKSENLLLPAFWDQMMKKYKWNTPDFWEKNPQGVKLKRRLINLIKRGGIPTKLMPVISKISGYALGPAELNQAIKAGPAKEERIAEVARDKGLDVDKTLNMYRMTYDQPEFSRDFFYKKLFGKMPDLSTIQDVIKSPEYKETKKYFTNEAIDQYWENKETDPTRLRTLGPDVMRGSVVDKYNQGGRVGYAKGPKDPGRRLFLKGVGALSLVPILGKYFKLAEPAVKATKAAVQYTGPVIEKIKGLEWVQFLAKRLWDEGADVTKTAARADGQAVRRGTLESGDEVDMIYDIRSGDVSFEVSPKINPKTGSSTHSTKSGAYNQGYGIDYRAGEVIEETGKKTKAAIDVAESKPYRTSNNDIELDLDFTSADDAISDLTELEAFAKKKTTKQMHAKKGTKPKEVDPDVDPTDFFDENLDID